MAFIVRYPYHLKRISVEQLMLLDRINDYYYHYGQYLCFEDFSSIGDFYSLLPEYEKSIQCEQPDPKIKTIDILKFYETPGEVFTILTDPILAISEENVPCVIIKVTSDGDNAFYVMLELALFCNKQSTEKPITTYFKKSFNWNERPFKKILSYVRKGRKIKSYSFIVKRPSGNRVNIKGFDIE